MPRTIGSNTSSAPRSANSAWIQRQSADDESRRLYEQERLVAWFAEQLAGAIIDRGMSRADLARELGTSRAYVTRILQGSANLTLKSLADIAWAVDCRVSLAFEPLREGEFISCPVTVRQFPKVFVKDEGIAGEQEYVPSESLSA